MIYLFAKCPNLEMMIDLCQKFLNSTKVSPLDVQNLSFMFLEAKLPYNSQYLSFVGPQCLQINGIYPPAI